MCEFLETPAGQQWLETSINQLINGESITINAKPRPVGVEACCFMLEVDVAFNKRVDPDFTVTRARLRGSLPEALIRDQAQAREIAHHMLCQLAPVAAHHTCESTWDARKARNS